MNKHVIQYIDQINEMNYRVGGDNIPNGDKILHESKSVDEYYGKINTWYVDQSKKIELIEKQNGSR